MKSLPFGVKHLHTQPHVSFLLHYSVFYLTGYLTYRDLALNLRVYLFHERVFVQCAKHSAPMSVKHVVCVRHHLSVGWSRSRRPQPRSSQSARRVCVLKYQALWCGVAEDGVCRELVVCGVLRAALIFTNEEPFMTRAFVCTHPLTVEDAPALNLA